MEKLSALDVCIGRAQARERYFHLFTYRGGLLSSNCVSCHSRRVSRPYVALFTPYHASSSKLLSRFTAFATADEAAEELPVQAPDVPLIATKFMLERKCEFGEAFLVSGEDSLLGAWDPSSAVPMEWSEGHVWTCQVDLPVGKHYEYKFVLISKEDEPLWQPGPNRSFDTSSSSSPLIVSESWYYAEEASSDEAPTEEALGTEHHAAEEEVPDGTSAGELVSSTVKSIKDAFVGAVKEEDEEELESSAVSMEGKDDISRLNEDKEGKDDSSRLNEDKEHTTEDSKGFRSFKFEDQAATNLNNGQPVTKSDTPELPFLETVFTSTVLGGEDEASNQSL